MQKWVAQLRSLRRGTRPLAPALQSATEREKRCGLNQAKPVEQPPATLKDTPRYPPYMDGLPPVSATEVLETQSELIRRMQGEFGANTKAERAVFHQAIENYAALVHLLPASETDHHASPGGLFRHGLEVALNALQASNYYTPFARSEYAERRKALEVRFRFAILVAALCHDIGKPVTDVNITDSTGAIRWNPFGRRIPEWAREHQVERYFLHWNKGRHKRHQPASMTLLTEVMGAPGKEFITEFPSGILSDLLESVVGDASPLNVIATIVKKADAASTAHDKSLTAVSYGSTGIPVERYYLSAIRQLLNHHKWKVNQPGSPFWVIDNSPYLVWPSAGQQIGTTLKTDQVRGIPLDAETIAKELLDRSLAVPFVDDANEAHPLWPIVPKVLVTTDRQILKAPLQALRVSAMETVTDRVYASAEGAVGEAALAMFRAPKAVGAGSRKETAVATAQHKESQAPSPAPEAPPAEPVPTESRVPAESGPSQMNGGDQDSDGSAAALSAAAQEAATNLKKIADKEPPRVIPQDEVITINAEAVEKFFSDNRLIGSVLGAFAQDLNGLREPSPHIETIVYTTEAGESARVVGVAVPQFFEDIHNDPEIIEEEAKRSGLFCYNTDHELAFVGRQGGRQWRLRYWGSQAMLWSLQKYRKMCERHKPGPNATAAETPATEEEAMPDRLPRESGSAPPANAPKAETERAMATAPEAPRNRPTMRMGAAAKPAQNPAQAREPASGEKTPPEPFKPKIKRNNPGREAQAKAGKEAQRRGETKGGETNGEAAPPVENKMAKKGVPKPPDNAGSAPMETRKTRSESTEEGREEPGPKGNRKGSGERAAGNENTQSLAPMPEKPSDPSRRQVDVQVQTAPVQAPVPESAGAVQNRAEPSGGASGVLSDTAQPQGPRPKASDQASAKQPSLQGARKEIRDTIVVILTERWEARLVEMEERDLLREVQDRLERPEVRSGQLRTILKGLPVDRITKPGQLNHPIYVTTKHPGVEFENA